MKYNIKLTAETESGICTLLTNLENGNSVEESWTKEDGEWFAENAWSEQGVALPSLYDILGGDDEFCDAVLNKLVASPTNEIYFNA